MKKRILSMVLTVCILMSAFSVVVSALGTPSDWAVNEINAAIEEGLVTEKVTENYQREITREEFCELVVKLYEKLRGESASVGENPFWDTDNGEILKAYSLGIVNGVSATEFAPNNNITRQEICVMLTRCINIAIDGSDVTSFKKYKFDDLGYIADWAINAVNYCHYKGIMKGVGDKEINPLGKTTCEQAILLVYRVFVNQKDLAGKTNTMYTLNEGDIATDEETGISYVKNIVIVFFDNDASKADKQAVVDSLEGRVEGEFGSVNQYQIRIAEQNFSELKELCKEIEKNDCVFMATYDMAVKIDKNAVPADPWGDGETETWNESAPSGSNWWVEAIKAPSAWDYEEFLDEESIDIGIVDDGFDAEHDDLAGKIRFTTKYNKDMNNISEHGTHVAGIIGAIRDNGKGISGITKNSDLICYDWEPTESQTLPDGWTTYTTIADGLIQTVNSGAKVINFSLGMSGLTNNESSFSMEEINDWGRMASGYMATLLSNEKDFVVVQSAGNGAADRIGVDAINNGWFASITEENCVGDGDTSIKEIMDRIIIVGAAQQNGDSFMQTIYSNGGEQVDICAPGGNLSRNMDEDIYSTVPPIWGNKYGALGGTSMAAPIVTGVASMVWAADPTMTGAEVKNIICDDENTIYEVADNPNSPNATGAKRMVNAKLAVEAALGTVQSRNIAEYKGVKYTTNRDVPGMVRIPVQAAKYGYYICSIAFYGDRLFYACKEEGSSDYKSAIYSCNLDGSDLKLIYEGTGDATSFTIANGRLYLDVLMARRYVDLRNGAITSKWWDNQNDFYYDKDCIYNTYLVSTRKVKEGKVTRYHYTYDVYKTNVVTGESECIKKNISSVPQLYVSGDNLYAFDIDRNLYRVENGELIKLHQFSNCLSVIAIIDDVVYYDYVENLVTYIASYDLKTGYGEMLTHHITGSSGLFFNW